MPTTTDLNTPIAIDDECKPAWKVEMRDIARGFAGAVFVSLPLLYTMEMWEHGRSMPPWGIIVMLVGGYFANVGLCAYSGFRQTQCSSGYFWDAAVAMGIGAVASTLTLLVTGIIDFDLSPEIAIKIVALEIVPTGLGAAAARNQLGGGDSAKVENRSPFSTDTSVLLGSLLGGILFAFNIAPTIEPTVITLNQNWWLVLATAILAIAVTYLVVHVAEFTERDLSRRRIIKTPLVETAIAYSIAFLVSYLLLSGFGYVSVFDPLSVWVPRVVTLTYATAIGGAAGRLIL